MALARHQILLKTENMKTRLNKQQQNPNLLGFPATSGLCAGRPAVASSRPWSRFRGHVCANTPRFAVDHQSACASQCLKLMVLRTRNPRADWDDLWLPRGSTVVVTTQTHIHTPRQPLVTSSTLRPTYLPHDSTCWHSQVQGWKVP